MLDKLMEVPFIKSLKWSWIIPLLFTLVPFILKMQPITVLTSTKLEQILLSKEKRLSLKVVEFIMNWLLISIVSSSSYFLFYGLYTTPYISTHQQYIELLTIALGVILCITSVILFLIAIFKWTPKFRLFIYLFGTKNKQQNWVIAILLLFTIILFTLLPNTFASAVARGKISFESTSQVFTFSIFYTAMTFIVSLLFYWFSRLIYNIVFSKFRRYSGKTFYILDKKDSIRKWFIYHPTDKVKFLIGNAPHPDDADMFNYIEKNELLEMDIHVYNIRSLN